MWSVAVEMDRGGDTRLFLGPYHCTGLDWIGEDKVWWGMYCVEFRNEQCGEGICHLRESLR